MRDARLDVVSVLTESQDNQSAGRRSQSWDGLLASPTSDNASGRGRSRWAPLPRPWQLWATDSRCANQLARFEWCRCAVQRSRGAGDGRIREVSAASTLIADALTTWMGLAAPGAPRRPRGLVRRRVCLPACAARV